MAPGPELVRQEAGVGDFIPHFFTAPLSLKD
jgi:hypothetical protein